MSPDVILLELIRQSRAFMESLDPGQLTEDQKSWLPSCCRGLDYLEESHLVPGEFPKDCAEAISALISVHIDRYQGLFLSRMRASGNWPETVPDRIAIASYYAEALGAVLADVALTGAQNRIPLASQLINTAMQAAQNRMRLRFNELTKQAREMGEPQGRA